MTDIDQAQPAERQPVFNLPRVVVILIAGLVGIHVIRTMLAEEQAIDVLLLFAFIPQRFVLEGYPGGVAGDVWTFVTYALLHGDYGHLAMNSIWLAAFGSPLAWRFGWQRFILLSVAGAIAGAAVFLLLHFGEAVPVVGASAAVSAQMAAASRFIFTAGGPLSGWRSTGPDAYRIPATPTVALLYDRRFLSFILVWFGTNLAIGLIGIGNGMTIAWEAHIGGFAAGLLLFPVLDPVRRLPEDAGDVA